MRAMVFQVGLAVCGLTAVLACAAGDPVPDTPPVAAARATQPPAEPTVRWQPVGEWPQHLDGEPTFADKDFGREVLVATTSIQRDRRSERHAGKLVEVVGYVGDVNELFDSYEVRLRTCGGPDDDDLVVYVAINDLDLALLLNVGDLVIARGFLDPTPGEWMSLVEGWVFAAEEVPGE